MPKSLLETLRKVAKDCLGVDPVGDRTQIGVRARTALTRIAVNELGFSAHSVAVFLGVGQVDYYLDDDGAALPPMLTDIVMPKMRAQVGLEDNGKEATSG